MVYTQGSLPSQVSISVFYEVFYLQAVCNKMGLNMGDRLSPESIKRKFLVSTLPDDKVTFLLQCLVLSPRRLIRQRHLTHHTSVTILSNLIWASKASMYCIYCQFLTIPNLKVFPVFQDFDVVHDYLSTSNPKMQARLRKRGQNGKLGVTLYLYNNYSTSTLKAVPLVLQFLRVIIFLLAFRSIHLYAYFEE